MGPKSDNSSQLNELRDLLKGTNSCLAVLEKQIVSNHGEFTDVKIKTNEHETAKTNEKVIN